MLQLRLSHLNVVYQDIPAIKDLSVTFSAATVNLLTGVIGAGKTSLLRALAGSVGHSGAIELTEGMDSVDQSHSIRQPLPRNLISEHITLLQFLKFGLLQQSWSLPPNTKSRIDDALERCHLTQVANSPLSSLTRSQLRLAEIAQVFVLEPRVFLLDEPRTTLPADAELSALTCISQWVHDTRNIALIASESTFLTSGVDRILRLDNGRLLT